MKVTVNGTLKEVDNIGSLEELVLSLVDKDQGLIVELNERVIKRNDWKRQAVAEGDAIELIRFVGGG